MVYIHNTHTMLTTEFHGHCHLDALYRAMREAQKFDPNAVYNRDTNTIHIDSRHFA